MVNRFVSLGQPSGIWLPSLDAFRTFAAKGVNVAVWFGASIAANAAFI